MCFSSNQDLTLRVCGAATTGTAASTPGPTLKLSARPTKKPTKKKPTKKRPTKKKPTKKRPTKKKPTKKKPTSRKGL